MAKKRIIRQSRLRRPLLKAEHEPVMTEATEERVARRVLARHGFGVRAIDHLLDSDFGARMARAEAEDKASYEQPRIVIHPPEQGRAVSPVKEVNVLVVTDAVSGAANVMHKAAEELRSRLAFVLRDAPPNTASLTPNEIGIPAPSTELAGRIRAIGLTAQEVTHLLRDILDRLEV